MIEVRVTGLADLQKLLDTLPAKFERNILRGALRAGMRPIMQDAKANVPAKSGVLRKGLKISARVKGGKVISSLKATGKHGYIAYWLEYTGAKAHHIKGPLSFGGKVFSGVDHPGFKPRPFLRPALDNRAQDALIATGEYIKKRLASKEGIDTADIEIKGGL